MAERISRIPLLFCFCFARYLLFSSLPCNSWDLCCSTSQQSSGLVWDEGIMIFIAFYRSVIHDRLGTLGRIRFSMT